MTHVPRRRPLHARGTNVLLTITTKVFFNARAERNFARLALDCISSAGITPEMTYVLVKVAEKLVIPIAECK